MDGKTLLESLLINKYLTTVSKLYGVSQLKVKKCICEYLNIDCKTSVKDIKKQHKIIFEQGFAQVCLPKLVMNEISNYLDEKSFIKLTDAMDVSYILNDKWITLNNLSFDQLLKFGAHIKNIKNSKINMEKSIYLPNVDNIFNTNAPYTFLIKNKKMKYLSLPRLSCGAGGIGYDIKPLVKNFDKFVDIDILEYLDCGCCETPEFLLKHLKLKGFISSDNFKHFDDLDDSKLIYLDCRFNSFATDEFISNQQSLKCLVAGTNITDAGIINLELDALDLTHNRKITDEGIRFSNIKMLICNNNITDYGIEKLKLSHIRCNTQLTNEGFKNSNLSFIDLNGNDNISDHIFENARYLMGFHGLNEITGQTPFYKENKDDIPTQSHFFGCNGLVAVCMMEKHYFNKNTPV